MITLIILLMCATIFFSQKVGWHDHECYGKNIVSFKLAIYTILSFISAFSLGMIIYLRGV